MPEEQNHDNVTLAAIMEEIKDMRAEAETQHQEIKDKIEDMRDDAKVRHQGSLHFAAYLFSSTVVLVGVGFWVPLFRPLGWQMFDAVAFIALGMGSAMGLLTYHQLLERRKRKALKGR